MKKRIWIVSLSVLVLGLLGALAAAFLPRPPSDKVIDVGVTPTGGDNAIITVEPVSIVEITQSVIKWKLTVAQYTFPRNGIEFDPNPSSMPVGCVKGDPKKAFHNCEPKQKDREFHCNRKPNGFEPDACYKYTVRVTASGSNPQPPELDPWIKNPPR